MRSMISPGRSANGPITLTPTLVRLLTLALLSLSLYSHIHLRLCRLGPLGADSEHADVARHLSGTQIPGDSTGPPSS